MVSVNICSVPENVAGFFSEFHGCTLDIVGMCKTRLNAAVEPYSRDRKGGDTLLHFRNNLKASILEDLSLSFYFIEYVFVQAILSGMKCIVGNIYRPLSGELEPFLSNLYEMLVTFVQLGINFPAIIKGDINIDLIKINSEGEIMLP